MALKKNIFANYLGKGWRSLSGIFFVPFFISYLGTEAYAIIGLYIIIQTALPMFLNLGITPTITRETAKFRAEVVEKQSILNFLRTLEFFIFFIALLSMMVIWLFAQYYSTDWINSNDVLNESIKFSFQMIAVIVSIQFVDNIYRGALIGLQEQVWLNIVDIILITFKFVGILVYFYFAEASLEAFFIWQLLVTASSLLIFYKKTYRVILNKETGLVPVFDFTIVKQTWSFSSGVFLIGLTSMMFTQGDKLLLSNLVTLEELSYYILAATLSGIIPILTLPISQAFYPRMIDYESNKNYEKLNDLYHLGSQAIAVILGVVTLTVFNFATEIAEMWLGNTEVSLHVVPILKVLIVGYFINGLLSLGAHLQLAYGWTSLMLKSNLVGILILIPLSLYLIPEVGVIGMAYVYLLLNIGYIIFNVHYLHRRILKKEKLKWYLQDNLLIISGMFCGGIIFNTYFTMNDYTFLKIVFFVVFISIIGMLSSSAFLLYFFKKKTS